MTDALEKGIKNIVARTWDNPRTRDNYVTYHLKCDEDLIFGRGQNFFVKKRILKSMKEGNTISDFVHLCETVRLYAPDAEERKRRQWWRDEMHRQDLAGMTEVERFVTKIWKPKIYRENGNQKKKTFDFINVQMSVRTYMPEKMKFVREHKKELIQMAVNTIKQDKEFKKYNVPVNYLKLGRMTLLQDSQIEYLFELKQVKTV